MDESADEIRKAAGVCGGKATIGSTRIGVDNLVAAWRERPAIEYVREAYPALSHVQVVAALEYYERHRDEIDGELAAEDGSEERHERRRAEAMAERRGAELADGWHLVMAAVTITKRPGVCGGRACIDDTRIRVMDVVQLQREGMRPEEMQDAFALILSMAQVHLAIQYAARHPAEIEADFASHAAAVEEGERARAQFFAERGMRDPCAEPGP